MLNRFTERAQKVIYLAKVEAKRLKHPAVGTEHLLLGLLKEGDGVALKGTPEPGRQFGGGRSRYWENDRN